jgi:HAD superfamily hydrolase (TIGR01509 family)
VPVRGVIFDLGSTLIYRTGLDLEREKCAVLAAFAAADLGYPDPAALAERLMRTRLEAWRRAEAEQVEHLATRSIADVFAACGLPTDDATLRRAEAVFFEPEVRASRLYPGARETLDALAARGFRLGLISNATSHQLILDITGKLGIAAYFDPLVTSAGFGRPKPHPSIFIHVLETWGIPPAGVVMVGDTLGADILGANGVGLHSILVDIEPNPDNPRFAGAAHPSARVTALPDVLDLLHAWRTAP